ncbi:hybrid sensor histidine kinase/response regulator transcription factor [Terrimonas pollutisoli]|uniref:hybrid sensor histidine kinase/response regulator transcription factor n=1 Tax=Terrimonas pollutisoli TaxID=3034147 RepID=UPI0023ECA547|nr:two-component regulator propeller domain-containing protein [Terrimonas sp. H1YJ31]
MAFNRLAVENGLSSSSVLSVMQDATGFMWFGTQIGLNRYDGTRFRVYRYNSKDSSSISSDVITSLFCDSRQTLWVGTRSGLDKYDPKKDIFERIWINGVRAGNIFCVYEDRKGNLWVGSSNGLHLLTDRKKNEFQSFYAFPGGNSIAGNIVRSIVEDYQHNLWIGTDNGLTKMKWANGRYQYETFKHVPGKTGSLSANYITNISEDSLHRLWIGTQNDGVNLYDPVANSFVSFFHTNNSSSGLINNNIRKVTTARNGKIWIGTQEGLSIVDPNTKTITSYQHDAANKKSLSQNSIYSIFEDNNGSMWVGTYFGGANSIYSYSTSFNIVQNNSSPSSLSNNVVSSIVEDKQHNLWIGTEGGGLNYLDQASGVFTVYKNKLNDPSSLGSNLVKVVYLDKDGNPWIGTHGGGLNVFDREKKIFIRHLYKENDPATLNSEIGSLLEDSNRRLWVSTQAGIQIFKRNKTALELLNANAEIKFLPPLANTMYEDNHKNIWIGTARGVYLVSGSTASIIDSTLAVNCILDDEKGNIWFGLAYGGLASYNTGNKQIIRYTASGELSNTNIFGLLQDDKGNLWLSSNKGLIKFDPLRNTAQTYTARDGLPGNEFNYNSYLKDSKGEFFFGGLNGITSFFPDKIETNRHTATVVFTGLKLFNDNIEINGDDKLLKENIAFAKELEFKHNQDVFTIEFALLNFIKSSKNKYAYKLDGFDRNWRETTTPSATYTNLSPGSYTLWVKGANNDGIWSEPVSINVKILPPFWLTWWAYCIYAVLLAAILFFVTRFFFLKALLKKEDELHQLKLNFFTNISHEIRTHLTLIMAPVDHLLDQKKKDEFEHQQLAQVKGNANRLLKLVSELMDFRKAETQHLKLRVARYNLIPFLQDIYTSFRELSLAKNIKISFIHDADDVPLYFDKEQLEKVFFNLLANAFKFTPADGQIILHAEQKEKSVSISVKDNGRGIAPQYLDKLFTNFFQVADHGLQNTGYGIGLALTRHIVELHKGNIKVESEAATNDREGKTIFTVTLLQGNKHFEGTDYLLPVTCEESAGMPGTEKLPPPAVVNELPEDDGNKEFTILIAEDNPEIRTLIHQTFRRQYQVLLCENGLQGWRTATDQVPDLVISDVMMPEMDGFELCGKLKTDERTSHIPVILLTAKSSQSDQVSGLETGADVYITKPFSTKVLELNVRNLLASREKLRQKFGRHIIEENQADVPLINTVEDSIVNTVDKEFLEKVIRIVEDHIDDPEFGVEMLSKKVGMSAPVLYKKIKAVTDMSVNEFVKSLRLKKAAILLQQKKQTVNEIAYAVGYYDRRHFSREFKKRFGKIPSEYIRAAESKETND